MATTVEKYIEGCEAIVKAKPEYVKGASSLEKCDCIGMDKYSFRINDVKFSTTGTNYSFRNQINNARTISSAKELSKGDVVFKAYEPSDPGYALPAKYREGGAEYNGDLRDYYHIGTVKSVSPLEIMHMTSPTAKVDTKLGKWKYAGNWKKEYIAYAPDEELEPEPKPPTKAEYAEVWAENGKPVNTRRGPDENYPLSKAGKIPVGTIVNIIDRETNDQGEEWCRILYTEPDGTNWLTWMKACFLRPVAEPDKFTVHIPGMEKEQADKLLELFPEAYMTKD